MPGGTQTGKVIWGAARLADGRVVLALLVVLEPPPRAYEAGEVLEGDVVDAELEPMPLARAA